MSYYNTTNLEGDALKERRKHNKQQEEKIFSYFSEHPAMSFTPSQVWLAFGQQWPLTSVRRSISDLTESEMLRKTGEKRMGYYGQLENTWQFVSPLKGGIN